MSSCSPGIELVVDRDLFGDRPRIDLALGAGHLLDLEEHGPAVLEDEAERLAHLDPARAFVLDQLLDVAGADPLVGREVENLAGVDLAHEISVPDHRAGGAEASNP